MSARDVIMDCGPVGCCVIAPEKADEILQALTAAGYRIMGPDEVDPVTGERLAKFIDNFDNPPMYDGIVVEIAAAIRALASGGKQ